MTFMSKIDDTISTMLRTNDLTALLLQTILAKYERVTIVFDYPKNPLDIDWGYRCSAIKDGNEIKGEYSDDVSQAVLALYKTSF